MRDAWRVFRNLYYIDRVEMNRRCNNSSILLCLVGMHGYSPIVSMYAQPRMQARCIDFHTLQAAASLCKDQA